jgi:hypothetical protein
MKLFKLFKRNYSPISNLNKAEQEIEELKKRLDESKKKDDQKNTKKTSLNIASIEFGKAVRYINGKNFETAKNCLNEAIKYYSEAGEETKVLQVENELEKIRNKY